MWWVIWCAVGNGVKRRMSRTNRERESKKEKEMEKGLARDATMVYSIIMDGGSR